EEIAYLLDYCRKPVSIIFVVPTVQQMHADYNYQLECVTRTMELYTTTGRTERGDNMLLLGTKWDALPNSTFATTGKIDVTDREFLIETRKWGGVWATFTRMQGLRVAS